MRTLLVFKRQEIIDKLLSLSRALKSFFSLLSYSSSSKEDPASNKGIVAYDPSKQFAITIGLDHRSMLISYFLLEK